MIFPKGKVIYENLNTSFTNFGELLSDLKRNQITGYVFISFWDYEGALFLDSGNIINAIEETENRRKIGQDAINNLLTKAKQKDGSISIYSLTPDLVMMLAATVDGEIVFKELTSDFTYLEKLIDKLKTEQHTGYIEVLTKEDNSTAIIFIQLGEPIESILSIDGKVTAKTGIHSKIYDLVKSKDAVFNVYRAGFTENKSDIITSFDTSQLLDFWSDVITAIENKFEADTFSPIFKKALIDKADDYPFLDPFIDEFSYDNGKITFKGKLFTNFSKGLAEVLHDVTTRIPNSTIKDEIENIKKAHRETIDKYSLEDILRELD